MVQVQMAIMLLARVVVIRFLKNMRQVLVFRYQTNIIIELHVLTAVIST